MDEELLDEITYTMLRGKRYNKMIKASLESVRKKYSVKNIEAELLLYFSKRPDAVASEIEKVLDLNKGQVSTALFRLCENGFLKSSVNPDDRRYTVYKVLDKGQQFIDEAGTQRSEITRQMLKGITTQEIQTIKSVVQKEYRNMTAMYGDIT